ncbi:MAG: hypothetical protein HUU55_03050 [Myxococcales bacterium]|nr:hypothetical protein [Myxococcales bacterium]
MNKAQRLAIFFTLCCACADSPDDLSLDSTTDGVEADFADTSTVIPSDLDVFENQSPDLAASDVLDIEWVDLLTPQDARSTADMSPDIQDSDLAGDGADPDEMDWGPPTDTVELADTTPDTQTADMGIGDTTPDIESSPTLLGKPFLLGLSANNGAAEQGALLGLHAVRPTFSWRTVEPTASVDGVTMADVVSETAIVNYITGRDWSSFDTLAKTIADAGMEVTPIVGHGFASTLPLVNGIPGSPDVLGKTEYLARQYLVTRATVERFDGDGVHDSPTGVKISLWQIENELNQAMLTAVLGWRTPEYIDGISSAWADWFFLTELLSTLRQAVLDADPHAQVTTNFHTDIHAEINYFFDLPSWTEAVTQWAPLLDYVSIDAYPNYYQAAPPKGEVVGERVASTLAAGQGKPVFIMETGYPTGPAELGYDEENQAAFMVTALESAKAAGAVGFYWFGTQTLDSHSAVITETDLQNMKLLAGAFDSGDAASLLSFALNNADYVQGQLKDVGLAVEAYWGIVRPDGSKKPAWYVLAGFAAANP